MSYLYFQFREEKLIQALAFLSLKGIADLTKLKAAKLLYFADKMHLNRFGRPITGDSYTCMPFGPVPSISLNVMNAAISPEESSEEPALLKVLDVNRTLPYPVFSLKDGSLFEASVFSRSEIEVLEEVVRQYGGKSAGQLVDESHREQPWIEANRFRSAGSSRPIPFESLFDRGNEAMLNAVREDQKEEAEWARVLTEDCQPM